MSLLRFYTSSLSDTTPVAPTKKMDPAAKYAAVVALFVAAGVLEIGGGWMWWQALREGKPWWYAVIGSAMLCLYGVVPTFQPQTADFGRVYAAYGCWFILLSLARRRRPRIAYRTRMRAGLGLGRRRNTTRRGRRHRGRARGGRRGRHHVLSALSNYKKPLGLAKAAVGSHTPRGAWDRHGSR